MNSKLVVFQNRDVAALSGPVVVPAAIIRHPAHSCAGEARTGPARRSRTSGARTRAVAGVAHRGRVVAIDPIGVRVVPAASRLRVPAVRRPIRADRAGSPAVAWVRPLSAYGAARSRRAITPLPRRPSAAQQPTPSRFIAPATLTANAVFIYDAHKLQRQVRTAYR